MKEQLISLETAILAKEKKFYNAKCDNCYKYGVLKSTKLHNMNTKNHYLAPTQALLQKWLRDNHNCMIIITPHKTKENEKWKSKEDVFWMVEIDYYGKNFEIELTANSDFTETFINSYEKALEVGLHQSLKLINI